MSMTQNQMLVMQQEIQAAFIFNLPNNVLLPNLKRKYHIISITTVISPIAAINIVGQVRYYHDKDFEVITSNGIETVSREVEFTDISPKGVNLTATYQNFVNSQGELDKEDSTIPFIYFVGIGIISKKINFYDLVENAITANIPRGIFD